VASPTSAAGAGTVPSVSVRNLAKSFGPVRAVQDVSFDVYPGEIFGLLGPNGSGKTTTIRMMLDIFEPDTGTVQVLGGTLDQARKDRIGYLPEDRGLYKDQRLDTVLTYLGRLKGLDEPTVAERLESWLRRLDLLEHREKKVQELSKGMQQKAQVIATLLHDPDLIVVDEPFSGLDPVNTRIIKEVFDEQRDAGKSIIMSTHQMYQVEALCSRIALINQGEVVLYGEVEEIRRRFAGNAVVVQGKGSFADLSGVVDARQTNGVWHLALAPDADPHEILRTLVEREDVRLDRFELAEASLDDIFVSVVQEGARAFEVGAEDLGLARAGAEAGRDA